jgi:hypothetical protein
MSNVKNHQFCQLKFYRPGERNPYPTATVAEQWSTCNGRGSSCLIEWHLRLYQRPIQNKND